MAEILELPKSPHGGRKHGCPFCGGRNFAPLKRAWYCYSGCGGKAYSNVDTAARHWGMEAAEACLRLADALGIPWVDHAPPWQGVAAHPSAEVAAALGLRKGEGAWLWDCPACGCAGTLRSYRQRWRCGSPRCASDAQQGWKGHVDVAMAAWHTTPVDACFRLAAVLSVEAPTALPAPAPRTALPDPPSPRQRALAALANRPGASLPDALYRVLLGHLQLGSLGRNELRRRRIDPARAEDYGFRSTQPGEWESRVLPLMAAFTDDELLAAGFPRPGRSSPGDGPGRPWWPGRGRAPLLVLPVWDGGRLAGIRFRNLGDPEQTRCPRYVSPKDANPDAPFHAEALARGAPTLHVVEGELNAFVLLCDPYRACAVGLPGAWTWQDEWALRIPDATRFVVGWFDEDEAGRKGAARVRDALARVRGRAWARARWRTLLARLDACELHQERRLAAVLRQAP
ncbi:MAG TPA: toprim domain-containing protein, partial [Longimicrobium sp.]|nr:toprim domain-containing protein [Longimicrobium sp.]